MVNSPMLARRLHHSPRRKSFPCILLRTLFRSLRSFSAPRPFFSTTCALFSQNTRVAYLPVSTLTSAPFRLHRHMRRVAPLSPVASVDCAYFPSPRGCAPQTHSLPSVAIEICSPFVFILLQIPFSPTPFLSHPYKTPGVSPPADRRDTHTLAKSFRIRSYENTRDGVRNAFRAAVCFWRHMHPVARRATPECFPLPRAVNLVPAARRQQRADARADQGECRSQYGFAVGSRADNRVWRAIVINRNASTESPTRYNRCPDQRMLAPVTGRFEGNAPYRIARDASVFTGDAQHQRILRGRLKTALRRCTVLDCDLDGLARGDLFQAAPIGFLHRPHQWVGCQREQRTEQCDVPDSFRGFHRKSPYIRAYVACWMPPSDKERRVS